MRTGVPWTLLVDFLEKLSKRVFEEDIFPLSLSLAPVTRWNSIKGREAIETVQKMFAGPVSLISTGIPMTIFFTYKISSNNFLHALFF